MKLRLAFAALIAWTCLLAAEFPSAIAEIQLPKPSKTNADPVTMDEFAAFYANVEEALTTKDLDRLMSFYAKDYFHYGITKKQLRFMWLEIFANYEELYSVHVFSKIDVNGDDAILVCTGALLGMPEPDADYEAVDRWVNHNHWLTRIDGKWKMIGGATHHSTAGKGGPLEIHPLF